MKSREDEAYITGRDHGIDLVLNDIAISLGRIADMLTEMNGYIVDYDNKNDFKDKAENLIQQ